MRSSSTAIQSFRFSTAGLPPRECNATLHALRELGIVPIEPLPDLRPRLTLAKRILPGAAILSGTLAGVRQGGTRFAAGTGEDLFLGINLAGESTARQSGRELHLRSGDAGFFVGAENEVRITRPTPVRFVGLRVPLKTLAPLIANPAMPQCAWLRGKQGLSSSSHDICRPSIWALPLTRRSSARRWRPIFVT